MSSPTSVKKENNDDNRGQSDDAPSASNNSTNKPSWAAGTNYPRGVKAVHIYDIPYPSYPVWEEESKKRYARARIILIVLNAIFLSIGILVAGLAVLAAVSTSFCRFCAFVLLAAGLVAVALSALGLWGTVSESYKVLLVYVLLMSLLMVLQLAFFFWSLFRRKGIEERLHRYLSDRFRQAPAQLMDVLEFAQRRLPCCGISGPLDYHYASLDIPPSCCRPSAEYACPAVDSAATAGGDGNTTSSAAAPTAAASTTPAYVGKGDLFPQRRKRGAADRADGTGDGPGVLMGGELHLEINRSLDPGTIDPPARFLDLTNHTMKETWDINYSQMDGCFPVMWDTLEHMRSLKVGILVCQGVLLAVQILAIFLAHRIARAEYINDF